MELLLMASIAGMLLILAMPVLQSSKSEQAPDRAAAYLEALSSVLERGYQQTQRYPELTHMPLPDLTEAKQPPSEAAFRYELNSSAQTYTLSAVGQQGLHCVLTLNQSHVRSAAGADCGQVRW